MLGNRDLEVLRHILNYCNEINYTIDTFGAEFEIFQSNTIY